MFANIEISILKIGKRICFKDRDVKFKDQN